MDSRRFSERRNSECLKLFVITAVLILVSGLMVFIVNRADHFGYIVMIARGHDIHYVRAQDPEGFIRLQRAYVFLAWASGILGVVAGGYAIKLQRHGESTR